MDNLPENLLDVHLWHWLAFFGLVGTLLVLDLTVFHRKAHRPSLLESAAWSLFWVGLALLFNGLVWWWGLATHGDSEAGVKFLTGFLIEKSLSLDNLFVFVVIFGFFRVPMKYQYRVLFWGVLGAIVMRLVFIFAGVGLISKFEWLLWVFGAFLVYTGLKLARSHGTKMKPHKNIVLVIVGRFLRITHEDHGQRLFVREHGLLCVTPLFLVLLFIESTDLLFAVDSVPAVIGITRDPFIVCTSNIFAVLGLRALYFLLAGVIARFRYLHYGLSAVLIFVGSKMIAEYFFATEGAHLVPAWASLVVIVCLLGVSMAASVLITKYLDAADEDEPFDEPAENRPPDDKHAKKTRAKSSRAKRNRAKKLKADKERIRRDKVKKKRAKKGPGRRRAGA